MYWSFLTLSYSPSYWLPGYADWQLPLNIHLEWNLIWRDISSACIFTQIWLFHSKRFRISLNRFYGLLSKFGFIVCLTNETESKTKITSFNIFLQFDICFCFIFCSSFVLRGVGLSNVASHIDNVVVVFVLVIFLTGVYDTSCCCFIQTYVLINFILVVVVVKYVNTYFLIFMRIVVNSIVFLF